jgi:diphthamide biosynthesis protein 2
VIQDAGRACYTFAVGKINPAKLANFAEIECFVLVACAENSMLDNERDFHVPVITPLELAIALRKEEWGTYSLDYNDFLRNHANHLQRTDEVTDATAGNDDEVDTPYFSLVTGKYVDSKRPGNDQFNLKALPGGGQLTSYQSDAANFLKKREYQGLKTALGETKVSAAQPGQTGIASNYGEQI